MRNRTNNQLVATARTAALIMLGCMIASAGTIDPSQSDWHKKYKKQQNAPKPAEMLLNEDKEPNLSSGFIDLFNGKDLTGWKPIGGKTSFEVKDGVIVGTAVPGTPSTYLCTDKTDFTDFVITCEVKWEVSLTRV